MPVVYVPGNHEYYDGEFGALEAAMHDAAASVDNVHVLNNAALVDPAGQWRVLGTTLWTDFALYGADADALAASIARSAARDARLPRPDPDDMAARTTTPDASRRAISRPAIPSRCTRRRARGSKANWPNRLTARRSSSRITRRIG